MKTDFFSPMATDEFSKFTGIFTIAQFVKNPPVMQEIPV